MSTTIQQPLCASVVSTIISSENVEFSIGIVTPATPAEDTLIGDVEFVSEASEEMSEELVVVAGASDASVTDGMTWLLRNTTLSTINATHLVVHRGTEELIAYHTLIASVVIPAESTVTYSADVKIVVAIPA